MNRKMRNIGMSSILAASALIGCTNYAEASMELNPGERSQQKSQQGMGLEGADSSSVILGGPEILVGRIEKIDGNDFLVQGDNGQFMKMQLTKDTNIVCPTGSETKLMTGRPNRQEQTEIAISPATEEQMKRHDPNRQQAEFETSAPSLDPSTMNGVVGSTDQEANKDMARGSGFVVGSTDCFKPGDHVRIEASDVGTITTIKKFS